jgi:hypothetical protein
MERVVNNPIASLQVLDRGTRVAICGGIAGRAGPQRVDYAAFRFTGPAGTVRIFLPCGAKATATAEVVCWWGIP